MSACKAGRGLGGLYRGLHQGRFCSTLGDRGAVETSRPIQGWLGAGVGCILSFFFKIKNKPTLFCIPWAVAFILELVGANRSMAWIRGYHLSAQVLQGQHEASNTEHLERCPVSFSGQPKGVKDKLCQSAASPAIKQSREQGPPVTSLFISRPVFCRL